MADTHDHMSTCIRCGDVETPDSEGYCKSCLLEARAEVSSGMRRLGEYLAAWAAFDAWLATRGAGPAAAT
jgi:hypothetical protein